MKKVTAEIVRSKEILLPDECFTRNEDGYLILTEEIYDEIMGENSPLLDAKDSYVLAISDDEEIIAEYWLKNFLKTYWQLNKNMIW